MSWNPVHHSDQDNLTWTQLRAIEILLRKCIPDLAAAEIKSEQTHSYVIEIPGVLSKEQWQKYGDGHAKGVRLPEVVSRIFRTFGLAERRPALAHAVMAPLIC